MYVCIPVYVFHRNSGTPRTISTKLGTQMTYHMAKKHCVGVTPLQPVGVAVRCLYTMTKSIKIILQTHIVDKY